MKRERQRITRKLVEALQPGETIWDTDIRGFGVRRQVYDKVYILKATAHGRRYFITIGLHGSPWTVEQARDEAIQRLAHLKATDNLTVLKRRTCTMRELCDRFLRDHAEKYKKPSSIRSDRCLINCHIVPLLGKELVDRIDRRKVEEFQKAVATGATAPSDPAKARKLKRGARVATGGIGVSNRALTLLSKMLNLAEDWNLRPSYSNPVRRTKRYKERGRNRYLTADELRRLGTAMAELDSSGRIDPYASAAIKLLTLTGARSGEIKTLRWSYVDLDRGLLLLPDSKTGQKVIRLSTHGQALLRGLDRIERSPFVFVGRDRKRAIVNIQGPWKRICKHAAIVDARLHDLRHTFASFAAQHYNLTTVGQLLGHTSSQTTARYTHLLNDHIVAANEQTAGLISAHLNFLAAQPRLDGAD